MTMMKIVFREDSVTLGHHIFSGQERFDFLAADSVGSFLLGRFEEDPPAKPRQSRPLGIRRWW